tara:strand:- start:130 stop:342 length:213 start_codon:yes stop_codon:yes gene_type:complete
MQGFYNGGEGTFTDVDNKKQRHPDAKKHQLVSFIKSGIRIGGYCFLPFNLPIATFFLILSEVVGIYEELV